ncbi:MAG: hypothetical protein A2147_08115 [Chloroflexi bacterium RBG_16_57_8]|nr:MAG: hypothetical protein A2147_08115 [Chloroflexi bacterium RBG_16_57_8]
MDDEAIFDSVRRTHRIAVADTAWRSFGAGSEIISRVAQNVLRYLDSPARIVASPDVPSPVSSALERRFYPGVDDIVNTVIDMVRGKAVPVRTGHQDKPIDEEFHGPF